MRLGRTVPTARSKLMNHLFAPCLDGDLEKIHRWPLCELFERGRRPQVHCREFVGRGVLFLYDRLSGLIKTIPRDRLRPGTHSPLIQFAHENRPCEVGPLGMLVSCEVPRDLHGDGGRLGKIEGNFQRRRHCVSRASEREGLFHAKLGDCRQAPSGQGQKCRCNRATHPKRPSAQREEHPASRFWCRMERFHLFGESIASTRQRAALGMTHARLRLSQKLAVDVPNANRRVAMKALVLTSRREGFPGGIYGRGFYDAFVGRF